MFSLMRKDSESLIPPKRQVYKHNFNSWRVFLIMLSSILK